MVLKSKQTSSVYQNLGVKFVNAFLNLSSAFRGLILQFIPTETIGRTERMCIKVSKTVRTTEQSASYNLKSKFFFKYYLIFREND